MTGLYPQINIGKEKKKSWHIYESTPQIQERMYHKSLLGDKNKQLKTFKIGNNCLKPVSTI